MGEKHSQEKSFNHKSPPALPTVTLIMPSHNRRDRLERALVALDKQTYPKELLELILVLDGCTDGSAQLVERLKPALSLKIQVISQPQSGPAAARNAGMRAARNDIILFIDDDVVASPQLVAEHVRLHLEDDKAVVIGPMLPPADHKRPIWVKWEEQMLDKQYGDMLRGRYRPTARQFYTGNASLARKWVLQNGEFDETFKRAEDIEFAFRLNDMYELRFYFNPAAQGFHYAFRTFESWKRMHYLYGRYNVIMAYKKGHEWVLEVCLEECARRDRITRFLANVLLDHLLIQKLFARTAVGLAYVFDKVGLNELGIKGLSSVANVLLWQGVTDELRSERETSARIASPSKAMS